MIIKAEIKQQNGVFWASAPKLDFEEAYLKVHEKEGRLLTDEQVKKLPFYAGDKVLEREWCMRTPSVKRFEEYLKTNKKNSLLELGCGNGWFSTACASWVTEVVGADLNKTELEQAARVFPQHGLDFLHWNILEDPSPFQKGFEIIVLNAAIQYFPNPPVLFERLEKLLVPGGEIHVLDSPFYYMNEIEAATARSRAYSTKMQVPAMSQQYYHHAIELMENFQLMYKPEQNRWRKLIKRADIPFAWYKKTFN